MIELAMTLAAGVAFGIQNGIDAVQISRNENYWTNRFLFAYSRNKYGFKTVCLSNPF